jgi:hypothetical protein
MMLEKLFYEITKLGYAYRPMVEGAYEYLLKKGVKPYPEGKDVCVDTVIRYYKKNQKSGFLS